VRDGKKVVRISAGAAASGTGLASKSLSKADGTPVICGAAAFVTDLRKIPEENSCFSGRAFAMIGRNYMT
jgi:hypothetical protein